MTALSGFDPTNLSRQQMSALALAARPGASLIRSRNGYGRVPDRVTLDVARSLMGLKLARVDTSGREPRLVLTGAGQQVEAVLAARAARRRA